MLTCLVLLLLIPILLVLVVAIVFGFGALLFTLLRFVLPFLVIGGIVWLICGGSHQRRKGSRMSSPHQTQQQRRQAKRVWPYTADQPEKPKARKDITNQAKRKDSDDWNDF